MALNSIRAVGDDRPWKDEVERELKSLLEIIKYGKISLRSAGVATGGGGGGGGGAGADVISATLPATYNNTTYVVGVDQDAFDHLSSLDYLQFDTAAASPSDIGRMVWNDTLGTLEFELKGGNVAMPIGQSNVQRVRNATAGTLTKGTVVYINGSNGTNFNVDKALATGDSTSAQTLGVIAEEMNTSSTQHGFVTTFGLVSGIDISYITGLTEGDILYLDGTTAGRMTRVKPKAPTHLVYVAYCLSANGGGTNSTIFVKPQNGYELDEIHDVKITTPIADNEVLAYTSSTSLWENKTGPEAGLITTSDTGTVTNTMLAGSIDNSKLSNSAVTVNGTSISLGASGTVTAVPSGSAGGKLSGTYPNPGLNAALDDLSDVVISGPAPDQVIKYNGTSWVNAAAPGGGGGTVTSITAGTGLLSSTGAPITTSGTISLADRTVSDKSANYTIMSTDQNTIIRSTGSAITITLANVLSAGQSIQFIQAGTGAVTFEAGSGVTLTFTKSGSKFMTTARYAVVSVICAASGVYYITGDILPVSTPFQFLLIAGGGSGGATSAGGTRPAGGGAGGMFEATSGSYYFTPGQTYSLIIGGGGAGGSTSGTTGSTGTNSTIEFHTATGDTGTKTTKTVYGGGRGGESSDGGAGGSGGGGGVTGTSTSIGGSVTTAGEGNAGGAGANAASKAAGGGGGAGSVGVAGNGSTGAGGNGGSGKASVITGTTYAGGGGGTGATQGSGGSGGGTAGTDSNANGTNVAANTGSGSGGKRASTSAYVSGNGGSGIAAIKYADSYPALTVTPSGSASVVVSGGFRTYTFTASATIEVG